MVPTWIANPREYNLFIEFNADSEDRGISPASLRVSFISQPVSDFWREAGAPSQQLAGARSRLPPPVEAGGL